MKKIRKFDEEGVFFGRKTLSSFWKASSKKLEGGKYAGGSQPSCFLSEQLKFQPEVCLLKFFRKTKFSRTTRKYLNFYWFWWLNNMISPFCCKRRPSFISKMFPNWGNSFFSKKYNSGVQKLQVEEFFEIECSTRKQNGFSVPAPVSSEFVNFCR